MQQLFMQLKLMNYTVSYYVNLLVSIAIWSFGYFLWRISSSEIQADYFCRLLTGASIFMPITAYHFSIILSGNKIKQSSTIWLPRSTYFMPDAAYRINHAGG